MNELEQVKADLFSLEQKYKCEKIKSEMLPPFSNIDKTKLNDIKIRYEEKLKEKLSKMGDRELLEEIYKQLNRL